MECKFCGSSMDNMAKLSREFNSYICHNQCSSHYYGNKGQEQWYDKNAWDNYVNTIDGVDWRGPQKYKRL